MSDHSRLIKKALSAIDRGALGLVTDPEWGEVVAELLAALESVPATKRATKGEVAVALRQSDPEPHEGEDYRRYYNDFAGRLAARLSLLSSGQTTTNDEEK